MRRQITGWVAVWCLAVPAPVFGDESLVEWSTWNIQYLYGWNFDLGKDRRDTLTFEHADRWAYGDNYFFLDIDTIAEWERDVAETELYAEWHPRLSLSLLFDVDLSAGPIADVLTAHGIDASEHAVSYLNGLGLHLNLPGFTFANVNAFLRDNVSQSGVTWLLSADWSLPVPAFGWPLVYGGYLDLTGAEGDHEWSFVTEMQLLLDIGALLSRYRNQWFVGTELKVWRNTFGIDGEHEAVPQLMAKWVF